ncbi:MAG: hypothetical protein OHK0031_05460 [Anaerolineales bacterium]
MMITAVLFDLDGTLRGHFPPGREFFADAAARLGLEITPEDRLRACRWEHYYWAESPEQSEDRRLNPDSSAFWLNYSRRELIALGASPAQAEEFAPLLRARMDSDFQPEDRLLDGAWETLEILRGQGYQLGIISNRDEPFDDVLARYGLGRAHFDLLLAAGEINVWKPAPAIFQHALQRMELTPAQAVYVGDNFYADVAGARGAGILPILLDPDQIFPEADCPVIRQLKELPGLLPGLQKTTA